MTMTRAAVSRAAGRAAAVGFMCAVLAACGTRHAGGEVAAPAAPAAPVNETCGLDRTTGGSGTGTPDPPTEERTGGGYAGPPTDEETGGYAGPPTDEETGSYAAPPTDEETGGYAGPPTDEETGSYAGPPTDQESGGDAGPPTDGDVTNGAGPCGGAGWFDMTRDFNAYYAQRRTKADQFLPERAVAQARVRKGRDAGEALVTFTTRAVGKGLAEDGRRVADVFVSWRRQVYQDHGTVSVRTGDGEVIATSAW